MAAKSTCLKCGNTQFELIENTPKGSEYKVMFVQCTSCGGVAGVTEYYSVGVLVKRLAEELNVRL